MYSWIVSTYCHMYKLDDITLLHYIGDINELCRYLPLILGNEQDPTPKSIFKQTNFSNNGINKK